ncbi:MAG: YbjN domain-containing protein [Planctomycetota bacterium]|nr:YbjN domain-containing protein [Planctomycetota bacterium]
MNTRKLAIGSLTAVAVMASVCGTANAQYGEVKREDRRLEQVIKKLGWKYSIDADRDFRLEFKVGNDRSQVVYLRSVTHILGGLELREILAPAFRVNSKQCGDLAKDLLHENSKLKLGAWQMVRGGDNCLALFSVKVGADCDAETLRTAVRLVVVAADNKEKQVTGRDSF